MIKKISNREKEIYKVTLQGSIINFALMIFKFIAGFFGRSSAMIADAVHSLTDFITDFIVIVFVRISSRPQDENHDFGHGKYETLATAIIGIFLLMVGVGIMWSGGVDIYAVLVKKESLASPTMIALIAAILSLVSKELLYQYTIRVGRKIESQAVIANAWHHRSDALSSIGTTIGIGGAILLGKNWSILDPIAAIVVSVLIIIEAIKLLTSCLDELLERSLPRDTEGEIIKIASSVDGVKGVQELRTRRIGNYYAIEFDILINGNLNLREAHSFSDEVEVRLRKKFGQNTYINIHIEPDK
ncbi:cation diffusion facilitator family transporter [Bacteroides sp.]|uniref:cation diffusion facilitator family transporter n=1 Tax=Bacteroides sp. TaxID=29523 RepID=UPI00258E6085|nr:cation diffusion facilitator family transporter [Bacteroides sp.]